MKLVPRSEWGARAFTCSEPLPPVDALVVHYSAADADEKADHANCAARVKGIQSFHMSSTPSDPTKPWCDVAYNFLFCKHGYVFVGRGWERKAGATGAANSHTLAACFLGDDTAGKDDVTHAGREALGEWLRTAAKLYPGAVVKGHRDFMSTTCPGNQLYRWIQTDAWKTVGLPRVRFELWARHKVEHEGKKVWRPYLADKSTAVAPGKAAARAAAFVTRVAPKIARLAALNRRPRVRRVVV